MCEATRQLAKARYELRIQRGNGVIDLGRLDKLLTLELCDEHQERT